jgi:hypothetical protein
MSVTTITYDDRPHEDEEKLDLQHRRGRVLEELEYERRTRASFHAAEKGGLTWRRRSPNQRFVAHRHGNR